MQQITKSEVEQYVSSDILFYLNGTLLSRGIDAYLERVNLLKNSFKEIKVKFPVENLVTEKNKSAVNYIGTLTQKDGMSKKMVNGMFLTFDKDGRIIKLYDVLNGVDPVNKN